MDCAQGACIVSLQPSFIRVELARFVGIPQMVIVGLPAKVATEAKERLVAIVKTLGVKLPHCRFVFSLSPVCPARYGSSLDLAMMVALLNSLGVLRKNCGITERQLWLGELRLDGTVCSTAGLPVLIEAAAQLGYREVWCSSQSRPQLTMIDFGINIHFIDHIADLVCVSSNQKKKSSPTLVLPGPSNLFPKLSRPNLQPNPDWQVLLSQPMVQKVLLVAAAGWHHTVLVGPPGLGKTTVAALLIELLPPLQRDELTQVIKVRSLFNDNQAIVAQRVCVHVTPQSTVSGLLGSVKLGCLGSASKAHKGVLFLDELLHFPTQILDALRDPLEFGTVALQSVICSFLPIFCLLG